MSFDKQLLDAAKKGDVEGVCSLLEGGADVNVKDQYGNTPLHCAVNQNHIKVIRLFLENEADIEARDNYDRTPLHRAAYGNSIEAVGLLLGNKANTEARDNDGKTPLHYAACGNSIEAVGLLLGNKANTEARDNDDKTPLHYAVCQNSIEAVRLLLENKANTEARDNDGKTPLHYAVSTALLKSFFLLLLHGADVSAEDREAIKKKPELARCLAAFEEIKAMPHLGELIEANIKKEGAKAIAEYVNDEAKGQELIKEFKTIKEKYGSDERLSFILKCLLDFVEHLSKQCLSEHKKDAFKTGALAGIIEAAVLSEQNKDIILMNDLKIKDYGISDKDIPNLRLACKRANEDASAYYKKYEVKTKSLLIQLKGIEPSAEHQHMER